MGAKPASGDRGYPKERQETSPGRAEKETDESKRLKRKAQVKAAHQRFEVKRKRQAAAEQPQPAEAISTPQPEEKAEAIQFGTQTAEPVAPDISPDSPQPTRRYRSRKHDKEQADIAASQAVILLALVDGLIASAFGPEAARNDVERMLIDDPLARWLQRADPILVEAISKWADPICILAGVTVWGTRLYRMQADKAEAERVAKPIPNLPVASDNGSKPVPVERTQMGPTPASPPPDLINLGGSHESI